MEILEVAEARVIVRKNLDEQAENASSMLADVDSSELDTLIDKMLPEAINAVHEAAPLELLSGQEHTTRRIGIDASGVGEYTCSEDVLRVVSFKSSDSEVTAYGAVDDATNLGRQQLNPYTRGDASNPVLVRVRKEQQEDKTTLRYYCHQPSPTANPSVKLMVLLRNKYNVDNDEYNVEGACRDRIMWYLTGMVATALGMGEAATTWYNMASFAS